MPGSVPSIPIIRKLLPYLLAVLSVVIVGLLLFRFHWLFERGAFALLLGCVFLSTWFGGWRTGIVAILASAFLSAYLMEPSNSFNISTTQDWIRLGIFLVVSSMIAGLHASRAAAVEAHRISEERLKTALDAARMGAWDKNLKNGAFWWSPGLEEIFGRRPGSFEASYEDFLGYIHPDDRTFVANAFTRSVQSGTEFEIEHRIIRPDGSGRWIITRGRILYDNTGNAQRLMGVAVDVTDRHDALDLGPSSSAELQVALKGRL